MEVMIGKKFYINDWMYGISSHLKPHCGEKGIPLEVMKHDEHFVWTRVNKHFIEKLPIKRITFL